VRFGPCRVGPSAHTVPHVAEQTELQKRVRAARAYAGLNLDDMASAVGFGRNTLVRIESGQRLPKAMELREVARVARLPFEFFSVDFADLETLPTDHDRAELAKEMARNQAREPVALDAGLLEELRAVGGRLNDVVSRLPDPDAQAAEDVLAEGVEELDREAKRQRPGSAGKPDEPDRRTAG
jgi:transcriptional regulator with XRE-family HTH domain